MAIKLDMLNCFVAVARHGSLAEASSALGRTPSAVSMMLKQFEDHIGSALFETARKSRLTPLGQLIFEEASREVAHFKASVSVIEGLSRSEFGYLRLAATPSVAMNILPPAVLQFTQRFPGVQLDIRDMDSVAITNELTRGRADIGIGTLPEIAGLRRTELFSDPFGVVCRKDHPLARDWDQLRWRDMQDYVMIANGLSHMITDPDFEPILAKSHLMVPSVVSLLGLVREGVGISVLPRLAALHAPDEIAFLPLRDAAARRHVHIVSQPHARQMPAARAFAELMTGLVRDGALASTL